MTIEGKLERLDLGPGVWVITTDAGKRFTLDASVASLSVPEGLNGKRVKVAGDVLDGVGIGMVGDGSGGDTLSIVSIVRV
jgi:hypothetical protein